MTYIFDTCKSLLIVSIVSALLTMLLQKTNLYQSIRFLCSIVVITYMVESFLPFYSAIGELIFLESPEENEVQNETEISENNYMEYVTVGICKKIKEIISTRYNINIDDIKVSVTINNDDPQNIVIKSVTVILQIDDNEITNDISRYVGDLLGCGCMVLTK